ncbi:hypothetical protein [Catalinimonas niigatensis]|uniref:hypothetical protein n=1 Tax=Catalinimonas niigatensis TaxID=1397264 RepID=UPI0026660E87|nr:hypothetical protein [Catalinimonas niigatensis]WPP52720.1 hypothetical protein PZB72_10050 [Catalinimonas niigatensis]
MNGEISTDSIDYTKNKSIPDIIRDEVIIALSHYPELADTRIDFVFRKDILKSFMQAQPRWYGIFQGKRRRRYVVKITPALQLKEKSIPVEELPTDALVGWLGHELGHIMDYETRTGFGLIRFGIGYLTSEKYLKKAEQTADLFAINHHLGSEILSTKHFILEHADIPLAYKERIRRLYMSPEEVMEYIDEDDSILPVE